MLPDVSVAFLVPQTFPVDVPALLADPIDFRTGELLSIDEGYDPTDGAVFTALRTVRASGSAVEDVGQKFHEHELVDAQLEPFVREETAFALSHLVDAGDITIESIAVVAADDYGELQLQYKNVAEDEDRSASARTTELVGRS